MITKKFISLGNQANRSNNEKYSGYVNNGTAFSFCKHGAVVTVKSSVRNKESGKNKYFLFSVTTKKEQAQNLPAGLNFGNLFLFFSS